jgi:hypothetical protein
MKLRGNALGIGISLAMAAFVAGCGSSGGSGTGGKTGSTDGGTGGKGSGGTTGADAGTGGKADAGADAVVVTDGSADRAPDAPTDSAPDAANDVPPPPPTCGPFADGGAPSDAGVADAAVNASFFVTSNTSATANLGGLAGADTRCQNLAAAVGLGGKTWHAYLSVEHGPGGDAGTGAINAKDRIGAGPWYNVRGVIVAANLTALHARKGDATVFIDEHGVMINGQWTGSPTPNQHDILTGTNADGTVALGKTCSDWTSADGPPDAGATDAGPPDGGSLFVARIGHTDGFGGGCSTAVVPPNDVTSWNSAHDNASCGDTVPRGGAGRLYCFAIN